MTSSRRHLVDLTGPHGEGSVLVEFRGIRVEVDKRRLIQLLEREQELLQGAREAPVPAPAKPVPPPAAPASSGASGNVSHASLSARVKKIFELTKDTETLRQAHVDMLADLVQNFDWRIPVHPNTRLDQQIGAFIAWPSTPDGLREQLDAFLERYCGARGLIHVGRPRRSAS